MDDKSGQVESQSCFVLMTLLLTFVCATCFGLCYYVSAFSGLLFSGFRPFLCMGLGFVLDKAPLCWLLLVVPGTFMYIPCFLDLLHLQSIHLS